MRLVTITTINATLALAFAITGCSEIKEPKVANQDVHKHWNSVQARLRYQMAKDCFESGQLEPAHKYLREAIAMNPEEAAAYVLMGKILIERGEIATARDTLEEAVRHGGDDPQLDYLNGLIAARYGRFDNALTWYRRAADRETMNAHYVVAVAETLVSLGRLNEALALTQERWTDFEQNATIRALAGGIYTRLGRHEEAANAYQEAVRIVPDDQLLQRQYGAALIRADRHEEATAVFADIIAKDDKPETSMLIDLGWCHLALNRPDEAKAVFRRAIAGDPQNDIAFNALARAALASDDLLTARQASMQAVELRPNHVEHTLLLAYICWRQNDIQTAGKVLDRILASQPNDPLALYLKSKIDEAAGHTHADEPNQSVLQQSNAGVCGQQVIATRNINDGSLNHHYTNRDGSVRAP